MTSPKPPLLTPEIVDRLPELYEMDGRDDAVAVVRYYFGSFEWWAQEGSFVDSRGLPLMRKDHKCAARIDVAPSVPAPDAAVDFLFFGFACLNDPVNAEYGYFSLNELSASGQVVPAHVARLLQATFERDVDWTPRPMTEVADSVKSLCVVYDQVSSMKHYS